MDEIKIDDKKEISLKEKVDAVYNATIKENETSSKKNKKLNLPRRAKVSKSRRKKGYCGILFVNETGNISGQKQKIEGGSYRTKDKNIHVTDGTEILWWDGKYPILFQRHDKLNPTNLFPKEEEKNQIYGQETVELRMKKDVLKDTKKGGVMSIVIIIAVCVAGYFLIKTFFPKLFGGG